jgi:LysR family transcriptional activator of nhaA
MDWLNYHHLRYFWVVAKEGSLARAAARLHVSQPSISGQIHELEEALGQPLFRRQGRNNVLTDVGQLVFGYANEIFTLGQELVSSVQGRGAGHRLRLHVGVVDSFPKLVTNRILMPVFAMKQPVHVICREGKIEDLLGQLVAHRLDLVLADEPAAGNLKVRTYNHRLGQSALAICAVSALARELKRGFPGSLQEAPALLPASHTRARRSLEQWFNSLGIAPRVLAEFEDLALMKAMAADGKGFLVLPQAALPEAKAHYGFEKVGLAGPCTEEFFVITAERRIRHPAVAEITRQAPALLDSPTP